MLKDKVLSRIMYDQSQFTPLNWIGPNSLYLSEGAYAESRLISGYAPDEWITYTQNIPESFWFGAYTEDALEGESDYGLKNFSDPVFVKKFEHDVGESYQKVVSLRDRYFSTFYQKEKEMIDTQSIQVEIFLKDVQKVNQYIVARYLLTQPQRFSGIERELQKEGPNKDIEIISKNGRKPTFITELRLAIVNYALLVSESRTTDEDYSSLLSIADKFGFLNWGFLGGELLDSQHIDQEVSNLVSDKKKLLEEKNKLDELISNINKRNNLLKNKKDRIWLLADIMGQGSVFRFDLQTLLLCTMKYVDNLLVQIRDKHSLTKEEFDSYEFNEQCNLISGGLMVDKQLLESRQRGYLRVYKHSGVETYIGEKAHKEIDSLLDYRKKEISQVRDLRGTVASFPDKEKPILIGTAFVLTTAFGSEDLIQSMRPGEILVATQTHPNLVPKMKEALAIVTDEGGVTCHAAIVSRELSKPCIVGTRFATKVIKTGDKIKIDLNTGTVVVLPT